MSAELTQQPIATQPSVRATLSLREPVDQRYIKAALAEARKGLGQTSPNPAVGAVLVANGKIIARGYHRRAGEPHAEVECLRQLKHALAKQATLYVTLEPCSTVGRTGPCTEAIIKSGIRRVVVGTTDVNPAHNGRGIEILREAGLQVTVGVVEEKCRALNEVFNKWIRTSLPFVTAKCGMSLDGRLTKAPEESQWLTSAASRRHARRLREYVDAVLVGAETARADDPRLTPRSHKNVKQPWRIVLTRSGRLPRNAKIFSDRYSDRTRVFRDRSLREILQTLGQDSITSVLIEGGGNVLSQALNQRLIDKVQIYFGSILTGGPVLAFGGSGAKSTTEAPKLAKVRYEKIGQEICLTGYPIYPDQTAE